MSAEDARSRVQADPADPGTAVLLDARTRLSPRCWGRMLVGANM
jgi:hypothetical protein